MASCCRTDLGREYARKLEQLRREEELIQEEELEAEALAEVEEDAVKKVGAESCLMLKLSVAHSQVEKARTVLEYRHAKELANEGQQLMVQLLQNLGVQLSYRSS